MLARSGRTPSPNQYASFQVRIARHDELLDAVSVVFQDSVRHLAMAPDQGRTCPAPAPEWYWNGRVMVSKQPSTAPDA
jgi:hypothetical protein